VKKLTIVTLLLATLALTLTLARISATSSPQSTVTVELLEPTRFERRAGAPTRYSVSFPGRPGPATLSIRNGDKVGNRVSSATVWINGTVVLASQDLNQRVATVNRPIDINDKNWVVVEVASKPGAFLSIQITQQIHASSAAVLDGAGGSITVLAPNDPLFNTSLTVPPGALSGPEVISIGPAAESRPTPDQWSAGPQILLEPSGLHFSEPLRLSVPAHGLSTRSFFLFDEGADQWTLLDTSLDRTTGTFEIELPHFSVSTWLCRFDADNCRNFDSGTIQYFVNPVSATVNGSTAADIRTDIREAFDEWEDALNGVVDFIALDPQDAGSADIFFGWDDGISFGLRADRHVDAATAGPGVPFGFPMNVFFNDSGTVQWTANKTAGDDLVSIRHVAMHEIGHVLGLAEHSCSPTDAEECIACASGPVMAPTFKREIPCAGGLLADDVTRIRTLYEVPDIELIRYEFTGTITEEDREAPFSFIDVGDEFSGFVTYSMDEDKYLVNLDYPPVVSYETREPGMEIVVRVAGQKLRADLVSLTVQNDFDVADGTGPQDAVFFRGPIEGEENKALGVAIDAPGPDYIGNTDLRANWSVPNGGKITVRIEERLVGSWFGLVDEWQRVQ